MVLDVDVDNRRLSLGHKQLEENPWDVFENVFAVGSIHNGTIVSMNDKGAIVALPYGVEGFAPLRHLGKEDGTSAREEDALDFKVIEFSKDNKKIILSHSKLHQEASNAEKARDAKTTLKKESDTKKAVKKLKDNLEKTTLGDIDALANLRADMVKAESEARDSKAAAEEAKSEAEAEAEATGEEPAAE
jgi:small subunit ribosomal protein S1